MSPGVHVGELTFLSDDSGSPPYEPSVSVRLDHCRQVFSDLDLPPNSIELAPGEIHEEPFNLSTSGGNDRIVDVDVIVRTTVGSTHSGTGYRVSVVSEEGTTVILKDFLTPAQEVYDDDTSPGTEALSEMNGDLATGDWELHIENSAQSPENISIDLNEWQVRLHIQNAPACVQE